MKQMIAAVLAVILSFPFLSFLRPSHPLLLLPILTHVSWAAQAHNSPTVHPAAPWLCLLNLLCPTELGVSSSYFSFHCWSSCTNQFAACNYHPLGSDGEFCPPGLLGGGKNGMFLLLPHRSSDMHQPCFVLWSKEHLRWSKSCNPAPMVLEHFSDW